MDDRPPLHERERKSLNERERKRLTNQHQDWLRFIAFWSFAGAVAGILLVWAMVQFDFGGIGSLLARSGQRIGYTALLAAGFASLFGAAVCGVAIMIRADRGGE